MSAPNVTQYIGVCTGCRHWQADVPYSAARSCGGNQAALMAVGEMHAKHLPDCPGGTEGRIKMYSGQWVERPKMSGGKAADGVLEFQPLPRWWVWR